MNDQQEKILILIDAGVFDVEHGKVEINCNNGQIQSINIHRRTYKRASENANIPI